ncbi:MAG: SNF2 helicase associated domain-containing protein, partial [bacterium]
MKITKQDILELVTSRIYQRGVAYYNQGRVQLLTRDEDSFTALVRGSRNYQVLVDYDDEDGWFDVDCTCPYWDVCKHVAAAMLAAQKEYETSPVAAKHHSGGNWNKFFRELNGGQEIKLAKKQKYQLLFLFQRTASGWHLMPKKQTIRQDGSLGALQNIGFGDFFDTNIKRSKSDDLVLSLLDKWKNSQPFYSYNYEWPGAYGYKFGEKLGVVFHLLKEGGSLYFSDAGKCGNPVLFSQTKGRIEFRLEEKDDLFRFTPYLVLNGQDIVFDQRFKVLTSDPVWLLQDESLIEIDDFKPAKSLIPFTQFDEKVTIPKEDFPQFLNALTAQSELVDYFDLPAGMRRENCESISEKRLYIIESHEGLQINLKFAYGLAEIDYNDTRTTFWAGNTEGNVLYKVTRNSQLEQQAYDLLTATRVKVLRGNEIVTRKNKELQWLIEDVPELLKSGFVIFGEENLQKYKINRAAPRVSVSVESGIDWF